MTCDPRQCMTGSPCEGCPLAERRRGCPRYNEVGARMRHWKPGEAEAIEARWVTSRSHRKDAEMIVWYDRRKRVQITLRKASSPLGQPSCMDCPSRRWPVKRDESDAADTAVDAAAKCSAKAGE